MDIRAIAALSLLGLSGCQAAAGEAREDPASIFVCTPVAVWDGDGPIWCAEGPKIRLTGIAAREMDGTCRPGHPCPAASAETARDALVDLLGGEKGRLNSGHVRVAFAPLECIRKGTSFERVLASCRLPNGRDLAEEMIRSDTVLPW